MPLVDFIPKSLELKNLAFSAVLGVVMYATLGRALRLKYGFHRLLRPPSLQPAARSASSVSTIPNAPVPSIPHIVLSKDKLKENVIIIGDVHGCFVELCELLQKCNYDSSTSTVIFVGDLINKGPLSPDVVKLARKLYSTGNAFAVRGNHEDWILRNTRLPPSELSSKLQFIRNLDSEDIDWLINLPYSISIPSLEALIVHAGLIPDVKLEDQSPDHLMCIRNLIPRNNGQGRDIGDNSQLASSFNGSSKDSEGDPWINHWKGKPHIYFGHDAKRGLQQTEFATGLDTGCVYGRKLTAILLPSREIVSVDAKQAYEVVKKGSNKD